MQLMQWVKTAKFCNLQQKLNFKACKALLTPQFHDAINCSLLICSDIRCVGVMYSGE